MLTKDNSYDIEEFEPPLPESHGEHLSYTTAVPIVK